MKKLMSLVTIIALVGCESQSVSEDELAKYMGADINDVISHLGKPAARHDMQDGTWEYIWNNQSRSTSTAQGDFMGVPLSKSFKKDCDQVLVTDRSNRVISYRTQGKC